MSFREQLRSLLIQFGQEPNGPDGGLACHLADEWEQYDYDLYVCGLPAVTAPVLGMDGRLVFVREAEVPQPGAERKVRDDRP